MVSCVTDAQSHGKESDKSVEAIQVGVGGGGGKSAGSLLANDNSPEKIGISRYGASLSVVEDHPSALTSPFISCFSAYFFVIVCVWTAINRHSGLLWWSL